MTEWKDITSASGQLLDRMSEMSSLLAEAQCELRHCAVFVRTREKMHPDGVALYDSLLERIIEFRAHNPPDAS